ncbi:LysE family translocator [Variovorax sp. PAMC 28711]|uniref:LysE family translocator n=1 Tax=Variovorax sp. PAMC 28711 TaxID=1795631 RepID=UPI00078B9C92|nr:LysE family translocator [Variovorax sp. PAMC 28711]AMM25183.1 lysine transporter LysE [Variovorax sp. PAMC 28711]
MIDLATLGLLMVAVLALFASPGPNMAFVLSQGAAHGPRGGLACGIGFAAGDVVHTLCAATGVTALVAAWAPAFDLLRYAGALYLMWLGLQALRAGGLPAANPEATRVSFGRIVRMAFVNTLVNPKALLFFMVFLPQFVHPANGPVVLQMLLLGSVLSAMSLVVNTALGAAAGQMARRLPQGTHATAVRRGLLATVMFGLAVRLLLLDRPLR